MQQARQALKALQARLALRGLRAQPGRLAHKVLQARLARLATMELKALRVSKDRPDPPGLKVPQAAMPTRWPWPLGSWARRRSG